MLSKKLEKPQPWLVDAEGVLDSRHLPHPDFDAQWDAIIVEPALKDELLALGVLNFTLRPHVERALIPLHGLLRRERARPRWHAASLLGSRERSMGSAPSATSRSSRTPWQALRWGAARRR
jgi:hypothetical protein